MTTLDPILVPYDGSAHAQAAGALARLLASATGARTWLVHALPTTGDFGDRVTRAAHADELLNEEALRFTTPVEVRLVDGVPAAELAAVAERAGLVVLGSRGRSVTSGLLLGSVARWLLRAVSPPVLVVHGPLDAVRRIVVGVDASPSTVTTVATARALADATGAGLTLVHVLPGELASPPEGVGVSPEEWSAALNARAEELFAPLRALAGGAAERVEVGAPAATLRAVAAAEGADIVAVGRQGASGRDVDAWFSVAFALAVRGPFATLVV